MKALDWNSSPMATGYRHHGMGAYRAARVVVSATGLQEGAAGVAVVRQAQALEPEVCVAVPRVPHSLVGDESGQIGVLGRGNRALWWRREGSREQRAPIGLDGIHAGRAASDGEGGRKEFLEG